MAGCSTMGLMECDHATGKLGAPADVAFIAAVDGSTQHYVEILPREFQPAGFYDVLIALHGHGADRWQYVQEPRDECKAARDFAAAHGLIFISPDYRAKTSWMGPQAESDLAQIIALLRGKHRIRKVFLVGASMGGTAALIFSALHPKLVAGISAQNGTANMLEYQNFQDAISASYGGNKQQKPEEYRKRSPELVPETFTMPVALTVGGKDKSVPADSARRLAARLQALQRQVLLIDRPDTGHMTSYEDTILALEFIFQSSADTDREMEEIPRRAGSSAARQGPAGRGVPDPAFKHHRETR